MKKALKLIFSLFIGASVGMAISVAFAALFTDISLSDFFSKLLGEGLLKLLGSMLLSLACFIVALVLHIILHEAGHLLFGLASGYGFVSFRVGSITLIKQDGKFRFKRFDIAGTGGQCLLSAPNVPIEKMPYFWYHAGGVVANLIVTIGALALMLTLSNLSQLWFLFLLMLILDGTLIAATNGIPMKIAGITNDGYNIVLMKRDLQSRKYLTLQLNINAASVAGVPLKDMPMEWFPNDEVTDYRNIFQVSAKQAYASLLILKGEIEEAESIYRQLLQHRKEIIDLLVKEIVCELLFLELVGRCRTEELERLYTNDIKQYVDQHKATMSSKRRLLCAIALHWHSNRKEAEKILKDTQQNKEKFLQQGEVTCDIEVMELILRRADEKAETSSPLNQ